MSRKIVRKLRPPTKKITGHRGQWTADVQGQELAVLTSTRRVGTTGYFDPMDGAQVEGEKHQRLARALSDNEVAVMQRDAGDGKESREGYIGLFSYKDLEIGEDGSIRLTLVGRVQ